MKRTELKRKTPLARTAKPASGKPKMRKCANRACRAPYEPNPREPFRTWCGPECALTIALDKLAKQKAAKAKAERAADRKKKQEHKTVAERCEPVRKLAQRYAVLRDHEYGCISCDKGPHWNGVFHGGHFKSVGSNSALQFNLWNINKQCSQCNFFQSGKATDYEARLRLKKGDEIVDWLINHPRGREYPQEYLDRLARILRKKIRRMEKRLGIK